MINDLKSLALNIFFILCVLFIYQIFVLDNTRMKDQYKSFLSAILSILAILLCMSFPFSVSPGFIFDLRAIPFIMGSLYGGYKLSIVLAATIVSYRFFLGGTGFYVAIIVCASLYICFLYFIPRFQHFSLHQKIISSVSLALFYSLISSIGLLVSKGSASMEFFSFFIMYPMVQMIGIGIMTYSLETMKRNLLLRDTTYQVEKLKVVSELAASVSHEVRNPLTTVRGFLQMMLQEPDLPAEKRSRYLDLSLQELLRAQSIITDYLTFAKPNLDRFEPLEMSQEIKYVLNVMTSFIHLKGIEVELNIQDGCWVLGDRQKLRQCLINLVKNAIEAMEEKGGVLHIGLSSRDHDIVIHIDDTGIGMTKEQLKRLGNPYYSSKEKGTGLGTMVAFSIIHAMGGRIDIQSTPGKGTQTMITFPGFQCV